MKTRIYFLDHLRTLMIFLVVLYHAGFSYQNALANSWIAVDPVRNDSIGLIGLYLDTFIMATLFFISGYFILFSAQSKSSWNFIKSKMKRVIVPWAIGILTMIPLYKMIFLYSRGLPQEPWFTYFHWYARPEANATFFHNDPNQHWLWFLPVLFLFQMIYLVLYRTNLLKNKISIQTSVVIVFIVGLFYSMLISIFDLRGWTHGIFLEFQNERLLIYFMIFLLGSLCNSYKVFDKSLKNRKLFVFSNIGLSLGITIYTIVAINLLMNMVQPDRDFYFLSRRIDGGLYYGSMLILMFSFLYLLLYTFRNWLNRPIRWMIDFNKNSYYTYIVHMVTLGLITWIMIGINIPTILKYLILTITAFLVSNLLISLYSRVIEKRMWLKVLVSLTFVICFLGVTQSQNDTVYIKEIGHPSIGLHEAVIQGNMKVVEQHINSGTDIDLREQSGGSSPLITAAFFGRTEIALALLEAGANPNLKNNEGSTSLHTAAFFCRKEITRALLDYGADLAIKNNAGSTALAAVAGPFEEVKGIYDYFQATFSSMGLDLDFKEIELTRPDIAALLEGFESIHKN